MCDGENRLKAGGGHGSLTEGKGEPTPETEPKNRDRQLFLKTNIGVNNTCEKVAYPLIFRRVLETTILIIRHTFHHGFGNASHVSS